MLYPAHLSISLVCVDEHKLRKDIEKLLRYKIPEEIIPSYEPNPGLKPEPIQMRSAQHRGNQSSLKRDPRKQQARRGEPPERLTK